MRRRWGCGLKVASRAGRVLTGAYSVAVGAISWLFLAREPSVAVLAAGVTLLAAITFLFILTALRMSAPAEPGERSGSCS